MAILAPLLPTVQGESPHRIGHLLLHQDIVLVTVGVLTAHIILLVEQEMHIAHHIVQKEHLFLLRLGRDGGSTVLGIVQEVDHHFIELLHLLACEDHLLVTVVLVFPEEVLSAHECNSDHLLPTAIGGKALVAEVHHHHLVNYVCDTPLLLHQGILDSQQAEEDGVLSLQHGTKENHSAHVSCLQIAEIKLLSAGRFQHQSQLQIMLQIKKKSVLLRDHAHHQWKWKKVLMLPVLLSQQL